MKGKSKKNSAIPHSFNAEAKVLAGIRWAHENEVLAVCAPVCLAEKRISDYSLKAWLVRMPNR
jgi:hypothetical protein